MQTMYKYLFIAVLVISSASCDNSNQYFEKIITEEYSGLYMSIFDRDEVEILKFTTHRDSLVRLQAWNAMISTPSSNLSALVDKVIEDNSKAAWASLWYKDLDEDLVSELENLWETNPELRVGLATVLGKNGTERALSMLLDTEIEKSDDELEFVIAYAVGELTGKLPTSSTQQLQIVRKTFESSSPKIGRSYLYGFYRNNIELSAEVEKDLLYRWEDALQNDLLDQFVVKILMKNYSKNVLYHYDLDVYSVMNVQLAIEIAKGIKTADDNEHSILVLSTLLDHKNPNVMIAALKTLQGKENYVTKLNSVIRSKVAGNGSLEPAVRLEGLNTINDPASLLTMVRNLAGDDPYLQTVKYSVLKKTLSDEDFFSLLREDVNSEKRFNRLFAINEFTSWWGSVDKTFKTPQRISEARSIVFNSLEIADRSMIYGLTSLFMDKDIIGDTEFSKLEAMLARFSLPEDVEVYQSVSDILKKRFENEALALIDSLASKGNTALNNTLANQGWDVEVVEGSPTKFRKPDWKRLAELGENPTFVLQTSKGNIKIKMDVLAAPATISGMDSLAFAGDYNDVAFHRVAQNFVIQGGDVETGDGFGGPDYVVPTEASAKQYERGVVGIASAGTDTEGSQYFVMHQWSPHLNGRYTIIGEVIEGLDVVDKIIVGDKVKYAYWEN